MFNQLTTWDEFRRDLAQAYENTDGAYDKVADDLMHGGSRKDALDRLSRAFAETRAHLDRLVELAIRFTPPEPPARPLEAVLGDIRALGFRWSLMPDNVAVYLESLGAASECSWWHSIYTDDGDITRAAEETLTKLRELHAGVVALVEALSYRGDPLFNPVMAVLVHVPIDRGTRTACGTTGLEVLIDYRRDAVTCPSCLGWLEKNVEAEDEVIVQQAHDAAQELADIATGRESVATDIVAGVGFLRIEDGQTGRFAVGELSREGDAEPWKVVRMEPGAPTVVYSFADESDAIACRDELNGFPGPKASEEGT